MKPLWFVLMANLLLAAGAYCNPGNCPYFPAVMIRDNTCYATSNCAIDSDCKSTEKCCENPCGVTQCYMIDQTPEELEICPIQLSNHAEGCRSRRSKFCFKSDCSRCCYHNNACNPASSILIEAKGCYNEICAKISCDGQGSRCYVDELSNKPYCKCIERCNKTRDYVCASDAIHEGTYINECYVNKEACEEKKTLLVKYKGRCKQVARKDAPTKPPVVKTGVQKVTLGDTVLIRCYGDNVNVNLDWLQLRDDGRKVEVSARFTQPFEAYRIDGRERNVVGLVLPHISNVMLGTYMCIQTYRNTSFSALLKVVEKEPSPFDRSLCSMQPDQGSKRCDGHFPNFYYDLFDKQCFQLNYTGCAGNKNNFQTLNECATRCAGHQPTYSKELIHAGEQCGTELCEYFAECVKMSSSSVCVCKSECSLDKREVCASDGNTYFSACKMRLHACRWRKPLKALYTGKCEKFVNATKVSSQKLRGDPPSLCDLSKCPPFAKCFVNPFTKTPQCYCQHLCTFQADVICASDGRHYLNACFLRSRACEMQRLITVVKRGLCV